MAKYSDVATATNTSTATDINANNISIIINNSDF